MNILPRLITAVVVVACCAGSSASAQVGGANNPYQGLESTKGVWPPFYKPDASDATYMKMMADGWCKPNGKRAQAFYQSKMVDVNKLPEFSFDGKVTSVGAASITAVDDKSGESFLVLIHSDRSISRVNIQRNATKEYLKPGLFVHFVGSADASGVVAEKLDRIELTSLGMSRMLPVEPNKVQSLTGKILRHDGEHLILQVPAGKVHRLEIDLKPDAEVSAHVSDQRYIAVGDSVKMKGRILRLTTPKQTFCFADDLDVVAAVPATTGTPKADSAVATKPK